MKERTVILFSGGLDSLLCALLAEKYGSEVWPYFVDYGQRHARREWQAAMDLAVFYGWNGMVQGGPRIEVERLTLRGSTLIGAGEQTGSAVVVPHRNLILCALAANYAAHLGAPSVLIGCNATDYELFPDCRPEFFRALKPLLHPVEIRTPLIKMNKAHIASQLRRLSAPVPMTWSCYAGGRAPCGVCGACVERQQAEA